MNNIALSIINHRLVNEASIEPSEIYRVIYKIREDPPPPHAGDPPLNREISSLLEESNYETKRNHHLQRILALKGKERRKERVKRGLN